MALKIKPKGNSNIKSEFNKQSTGFLKIDEFKNHTMLLDKITKIVSVKGQSKILEYFKDIDQFISPSNNDNYSKDNNNIYSFWQKNNTIDKQFIIKLQSYIDDLKINLQTTTTTFHKQIVVAGGFSSGKSTFLNSLVQNGGSSKKLLPTSIEPTSSISTYIYFSKDQKEIEVLGENINKRLINIGLDALSSIQHSKGSNVYLASVLERLFVKVPSTDLDGFAFIDTPGYNNSDKINKFNNRTDEDTAKESLVHGDILFWVIDSEDGLAKQNDYNFLKKFSKEIVFILNKADKKRADLKSVINQVKRDIKEAGLESRIIDIITYSSFDSSVFSSQKGYSNINKLLEAIKGQESLTTQELFFNKVNDLFNDNLNDLEEQVSKYENKHNKACDKVLEKEKYLKKASKDLEELKNDTLKVMESYEAFVDYTGKLIELHENLKRLCLDAYNRELEWMNKGSFFSSGKQDLIDAYNKAKKNYHKNIIEEKESGNRFEEFFDEDFKEGFEEGSDEDFQNYYKTKFIGPVKNKITAKLSDQIKNYENIVKQAIKEKDDNSEAFYFYKCEYKSFNDLYNVFKKQLVDLLEKVKNNSNEIVDITTINKSVINNVFEAIDSNSMTLFYSSFIGEGVEVDKCNGLNYNPMTYAVKSGNINMVKFFLEENIDPRTKDKRGLNMFETALENNNRNICDLILKHDDQIEQEVVSNADTLISLVKKNSFYGWMEQRLNLVVRDVIEREVIVEREVEKKIVIEREIEKEVFLENYSINIELVNTKKEIVELENDNRYLSKEVVFMKNKIQELNDEIYSYKNVSFFKKLKNLFK